MRSTIAGPMWRSSPISERRRGVAEAKLRRVSVTHDRSVSAGEDLARAFTLPASAYIDRSVYERERDRIFARTWQLVARADELSRVGDLKPATILDEPILITRGLDGNLRGFYNVCRHRAAQVVVAKGNRRSLQCPYHGWTYGLDGRLQVAREMEGTENFDTADFGLVPIRGDQWGPFIFANLDNDAPSLRDVLGAIPQEVSTAGYDVEKMQLVERRGYVIDCYWEGDGGHYLGGDHLPLAAPSRTTSRRPVTTPRRCSWWRGATMSSTAIGRCTSTITWRGISCRSRIRDCSRSWTTMPTGSKPSATTRSSTLPFGS